VGTLAGRANYVPRQGIYQPPPDRPEIRMIMETDESRRIQIDSGVTADPFFESVLPLGMGESLEGFHEYHFV